MVGALSPDLPNPSSAEQRLPDLKTTMSETMVGLEAKNQELGGELFGVFGEGETRFGIFDTSLKRQPPQAHGFSEMVDEFLVVTGDGFKLIRADERAMINENAGYPDEAVSFTETWLPTHISWTRKSLTGPIIQEEYKTEGQLRFFGKTPIIIDKEGLKRPNWPENPAIRFVEDVDPDTVVELVRINKERIDKVREEQVRVGVTEQERLNTLMDTRRRIDEILG